MPQGAVGVFEWRACPGAPQEEVPVLAFFAFIKNDSNSNEEEKRLHELPEAVGTSACFPAFAVRALAHLTSQSSPVVCYGGMASHKLHVCTRRPGLKAPNRRTKILKVKTVEAGDGESSPHAGHRQRQLSCENGLFLLLVQQQVWQRMCGGLQES